MDKLYGVLAAALVRDTVDRWERPQPPRTAQPGDAEPVRALAGTPMHGRSVRGVEQACTMLVRLRVAHAFDEAGERAVSGLDQYRYAWSYRLAIDGPRATAIAAQRSVAEDLPPIDEVLAAWLGCATHFELVRGTRSPFRPGDDARDVVGELVRLGYAKPFGASILWTDQIAPAMRLAGLWDAESQSSEDLDAVDAEMRTALKALPKDVRDAALRNSVPDVQMALCSRWIDGAWKPPPRPGTHVPLVGGNGPARRLIELVTENGGAEGAWR